MLNSASPIAISRLVLRTFVRFKRAAAVTSGFAVVALLGGSAGLNGSAS
jgi:hypothetical protein